jgi:hypothetical protein
LRRDYLFLLVGEINIFNYTGDIFPSSRSLHTLQLRGCDKLTTLGDYENLEVLELNSCPRLASIGRVDGLSVLKLNVSMESISLLSFPLEKLITLEISRYQIADFLLSMKRFHRLEILKALFSSNQYQDINVLPPLPISTLQTLTLKGWDSIDVSGLINLTQLEVGSASTVIGKMDVYPQLRSLKGYEDAFLKDDMTKYPKLTSFVYQHMTGRLC